jgi:hypothetical protein
MHFDVRTFFEHLPYLALLAAAAAVIVLGGGFLLWRRERRPKAKG